MELVHLELLSQGAINVCLGSCLLEFLELSKVSLLLVETLAIT